MKKNGRTILPGRDGKQNGRILYLTYALKQKLMGKAACGFKFLVELVATRNDIKRKS